MLSWGTKHHHRRKGDAQGYAITLEPGTVTGIHPAYKHVRLVVFRRGRMLSATEDAAIHRMEGTPLPGATFRHHLHFHTRLHPDTAATETKAYAPKEVFLALQGKEHGGVAGVLHGWHDLAKAGLDLARLVTAGPQLQLGREGDVAWSEGSAADTARVMIAIHAHPTSRVAGLEPSPALSPSGPITPTTTPVSGSQHSPAATGPATTIPGMAGSEALPSGYMPHAQEAGQA